MKSHHIINHIFRPFEYRRLHRNVRAWIGLAIKKGPHSVEHQFVTEWSARLRFDFGK